jgi:hypothetical protein
LEAGIIIYLVIKIKNQKDDLKHLNKIIKYLRKTPTGWQEGHSKCIDSCCVEKVLDDIIKDI